MAHSFPGQFLLVWLCCFWNSGQAIMVKMQDREEMITSQWLGSCMLKCLCAGVCVRTHVHVQVYVCVHVNMCVCVLRIAISRASFTDYLLQLGPTLCLYY